MQKSLLSLYLRKVADGDRTVVVRLCGQLADRLIFVPTEEQGRAGATVKVSVLNIEDERGVWVPVFTNERHFEEWAGAEGRSAEGVISLLGADFCAALTLDLGLLVDPGSDHPLYLLPGDVQQIAGAGGSTEISTLVDPGTEPPPAVPSDAVAPEEVGEPLPAEPAMGNPYTADLGRAGAQPVPFAPAYPEPAPRIRREEFPSYVSPADKEPQASAAGTPDRPRTPTAPLISRRTIQAEDTGEPPLPQGPSRGFLNFLRRKE